MSLERAFIIDGLGEVEIDVGEAFALHNDGWYTYKGPKAFDGYVRHEFWLD